MALRTLQGNEVDVIGQNGFSVRCRGDDGSIRVFELSDLVAWTQEDLLILCKMIGIAEGPGSEWAPKPLVGPRNPSPG